MYVFTFNFYIETKHATCKTILFIFIVEISHRGDFFPQLLNWFQFYSCGEKLPKVVGHSQPEQVKNGAFERGCRWFQLFYIDFQLFYFLTRIITDPNYRSDCTYK